MHIQGLNLRSGPGRFSQELQTGFNTRIVIKTADIDPFPHFYPAIMRYQARKNHFQSETVERVVGLRIVHRFTRVKGHNIALDPILAIF